MAGDVSVPSSNFKVDTDTLYVDASNDRVGVNTNTPSRDLQIGNGGSNAAVAIVASNTALSQLAFGDTDDDNYGQILVDHSTNKLQIQNGGGGPIIDRGITLDSSENVGIGTASPQSRLHIANATGNNLGLIFINPTETVRQYFADDSTDSDFFITYDGNGGAEITLQHDGKLALNASNGDNVGMSTINPSKKLTVDGNIKIDGNSREFYFAGNQAQIRASSASTDITFVNSSTELVRFASDGNVGIGTSDPSAQLTVSGDGIRIISTGTNANNGEARIGVVGNNSRPNFELGPQGNSDEFQIINGGDWRVRTTTTRDLAFGTNSTNAIYIEGTNQNVGIGTDASAYTLEVDVSNDDWVRFKSDDNKMGLILADNDTVQYLMAENSALSLGHQAALHNENLNIIDGGDVGIGTTTPSGKLHVFNTGNASGDIFIVDGSHGRLFNVSDETTGIIFSVNDAAGLPV